MKDPLIEIEERLENMEPIMDIDLEIAVQDVRYLLKLVRVYEGEMLSYSALSTYVTKQDIKGVLDEIKQEISGETK